MDMYNNEILSYRISEKPNALAIMEGLEEYIAITASRLIAPIVAPSIRIKGGLIK